MPLELRLPDSSREPHGLQAVPLEIAGHRILPLLPRHPLGQSLVCLAGSLQAGETHLEPLGDTLHLRKEIPVFLLGRLGMSLLIFDRLRHHQQPKRVAVPNDGFEICL